MNESPLFTPFSLKGLTLSNRFVMPAMQRGMARNGEPTAQMADAYRDRAAGGVSLIISESSAVSHPSADWKPEFCRLNRHTLGGWRRIADTVHEAGSHFFVQLWHPGSIREVDDDYASASQPSLSPSGLVREGLANGVAMTRANLADIRDSFVHAALIAREAGADGVEVHACHGYLLDQFLWAETNRRDDEYGGESAADRARYPAEIVAAIRAAVGQNCPISLRFSQFKEVAYGARICETPEDLGAMLDILRSAGVDVFHASARRFHRPAWPQSPLSLAGWTKSKTDAPVITVGSVGLSTDILENLFDGRAPVETVANSVDLLERGLVSGEFDLVAVGRSLIADPNWVRKIYARQYDAIPTFSRDMLGAAVAELSDAIAPSARIVNDEEQ